MGRPRPGPRRGAGRGGPGGRAGGRLRDNPLVRSGPVHADPGTPGWRRCPACCELIVEGPAAQLDPAADRQRIPAGQRQFRARASDRQGVPDRQRQQVVAPGTSVTILAQNPTVLQQHGRLSGQTNRASVVVSWQQLATLEPNGQYKPASPGQAAQRQVFTLESIKGQWRIDGLPQTGTARVSTELLLPSTLFRLVYAHATCTSTRSRTRCWCRIRCSSRSSPATWSPPWSTACGRARTAGWRTRR